MRNQEIAKGLRLIAEGFTTLAIAYEDMETTVPVPVQEVVEEEVIKYNNYSGKKILIALDNHLDINKFTELLVNYNVDISTSSSIEELTELLRSDKTFDIVFLSNTISGIENYDITTSEERKRTMTKLSLIAGYKLQIIMVTLEDYKDSDTEYIKMPICSLRYLHIPKHNYSY